MPFLRRVVFVVGLLLATLAAVGAGTADETFSLPHATLLFGSYDRLQIVTPKSARAVSPPAELGANHGYFAHPSLSSTASFVAWGFATALDNTRQRYRARYALGMYAMDEGAWTTFGDFDNIGAVAVSLDGSRIALVGLDRTLGGLMIFDTATRRFTRSALLDVQWPSRLSWSPDGLHIVIQTDRYRQPPAISVVELSTGRVHQIAEGRDPSWSPTGEWIAYIDDQQMTCRLVHPDGNDPKVVARLHDDWLHVLILGYHRFLYGEVWSPDGSELLLNEENADGPSVRVLLLNVVTGRSVRMSANGVPVFGWARDDAR